MNDFLLFGVLPYLTLAIFLLATIQRYRQRTFTYSSLSSQFLENRHHFWGSVPFHYGILAVLALHLVALVIPRGLLAWNAVPVRLFALEITGFAAAVLTLVGLVNLVLRRFTNPRLRVVTTLGDRVVYLLLFTQVLTGMGIAVFHGWGSSWFATSATPWMWSLLRLDPEVAYVAGLPWLVKAHILNAFALVGFFPFTRLVHVLVVPNQYLWRKTQVVLWNHDRGRLGSKEA